MTRRIWQTGERIPAYNKFYTVIGYWTCVEAGEDGKWEWRDVDRH